MKNYLAILICLIFTGASLFAGRQVFWPGFIIFGLGFIIFTIGQFKPNLFKQNGKPAKNFALSYQANGDFEYYDWGFLLMDGDKDIVIKWEDITEIVAFKKDLIAIDEICLTIVIGDYRLTISEEIEGWHQFIKRLDYFFPEIDPDWFPKIVLPPFKRNETVLFSRDVLQP